VGVRLAGPAPERAAVRAGGRRARLRGAAWGAAVWGGSGLRSRSRQRGDGVHGSGVTSSVDGGPQGGQSEGEQAHCASSHRERCPGDDAVDTHHGLSGYFLPQAVPLPCSVGRLFNTGSSSVGIMQK